MGLQLKMLKLTLVLGLVACVGQIIGEPLTRPLNQESQNRLKAFKSMLEKSENAQKTQGIGSGMMSKLMDSIMHQLSKGEPIKMVVDVKPQDVQRWLSPAEGEEPAQKETQGKKDQKDLKNPGGFRSGGCLPAGEWCEMSAPKCCSGNCYPSGCPIFANPTSCS